MKTFSLIVAAIHKEDFVALAGLLEVQLHILILQAHQRSLLFVSGGHFHCWALPFRLKQPLIHHKNVSLFLVVVLQTHGVSIFPNLDDISLSPRPCTRGWQTWNGLLLGSRTIVKREKSCLVPSQ